MNRCTKTKILIQIKFNPKQEFYPKIVHIVFFLYYVISNILLIQ